MTDDVCGHPTTGTEPCQNPTSDTGSDPTKCWIPTHNDPNANNPHGQPSSINQDDHDDILQAAREGLSKSGCARAAGTTIDSLNRYLENHPDFREAFMRARYEGERKLAQGALYREDDAPEWMDGQHARFLLSTSFGYVKTERKEVEMDADVDHKGGITADFIAFTDNEDRNGSDG